MNDISHVSYRINEKNEIIFVNDEWSKFALANDAPELVAEKVLNRNLWDFISDDATREIYQKLVDKVRAGRPINFDFRCDSHDLRRFLEMKITLQADEIIQFDTYMINTEARIQQNIFQKDTRRADSVILVCSWCKKFDAADGDWQEIEEVLSNMKVFDAEYIPQLSHGMCVACYQSISKQHQNTFVNVSSG